MDGGVRIAGVDPVGVPCCGASEDLLDISDVDPVGVSGVDLLGVFLSVTSRFPIPHLSLSRTMPDSLPCQPYHSNH